MVSALVRGRVWYLSMFFVLPGDQGRGLGRALLERGAGLRRGARGGDSLHLGDARPPRPGPLRDGRDGAALAYLPPGWGRRGCDATQGAGRARPAGPGVAVRSRRR